MHTRTTHLRMHFPVAHAHDRERMLPSRERKKTEKEVEYVIQIEELLNEPKVESMENELSNGILDFRRWCHGCVFMMIFKLSYTEKVRYYLTLNNMHYNT